MLTHRAKYAIKALLHLARHQGAGPVQAGAIAAAEAIPHKFFEAILIQLRHQGIIRSKVGKGGGHGLAKAPQEIAILSVIRAIDGPVALPYLSHTAYQRCSDCVSEASCGCGACSPRPTRRRSSTFSRAVLSGRPRLRQAGREREARRDRQGAGVAGRAATRLT